MVGNLIPSNNVSANPLEIRIPVAITPLVTADNSNPGKAVIKVSPTADNTEYALADSFGNIIHPFTLPMADENGTVIFNNLNPDSVYTLFQGPWAL